MRITLKGEQDTAELGTSTDAYNTCTTFFLNFWQTCFFLMLTKEYICVCRNFFNFTLSQKGRRPNPCQLLGHPKEDLYNSAEQKSLMSVCMSVCMS